MLARTDAPRDGLTDGPGTYNHYYFSRTFLPFLWVMLVSRR
jgi:hypothetical protein